MSIYDSCVFIKTNQDGTCIIITWVDDLLIGSKGDKILHALLERLSKKYRFKKITDPQLFLGVKLKRDKRTKPWTLLSQTMLKKC
jgi:hypothetical protein